MKTQAFNPYLPCWEYVPDGEPHIFGNRLYIYGSHDLFNGDAFCLGDYVCWSAFIDDLTDWKYEGVIYKKVQDPRNAEGQHCLYAPDVCFYKGKYYLFYGLDNLSAIGVAVCDSPCGKFEFLGFVRHSDGRVLGSEGDLFQFDPGVLVDGDEIYLFSGNSPMSKNSGRNEYSQVMQLYPDMLTIKSEPKKLIPSVDDSEGTGFEGHEFFEASSPRKINGKYYFVYSSVKSHELCYAVSDYPDKNYSYGGTLIDIGNVGLNGITEDEAQNALGNTHGGLVQLYGEWYIFYHRQTNRTQFSRQGCAERLTFKNGKFEQAEVTSCGLNGKPLCGKGVYPAYIACSIIGSFGRNCYHMTKEILDKYLDKYPAVLNSSDDGKELAKQYLQLSESCPYFTQEGVENDAQQFISNVTNNSLIAFKYFDFEGPCRIRIKARGAGMGKVKIGIEKQKFIAEIEIKSAEEWTYSPTAELNITKGIHPIFFSFDLCGTIQFLSFELL